MKKELSTYLDLLRFGAAIVVFVGHLSWRAISGGFLWRLPHYGHSAVIVFFVLSGFVIQYAADTKERTLLDYSAARLARLYSVVLPALLLTAICDAIGTAHNPNVYFMDREDSRVWRLVTAATFLSQSWGHIDTLSNDAYWSLPYEFWYYVLFAAITFLKGPQRIAATLLGAMIAGPGILILAPLWAAGVITYRLMKRITIGKTMALCLWAATAAATIGIAMVDSPITRTTPFLPSAYSGWDFPLAVAVSANILSANFLSFGLAKFHRPVAKLAGMTFALYLFHLPLLHLGAAYLPADMPASVKGPLLAGGTLAMIYLLSRITEGQKHRWRHMFQWLFCRRAIRPVESLQ